MFRLLVATHNQGKIRRYQRLFSDIKNLKLLTLADLKINYKADEPFSTPQENSVYKAKIYGDLSKLPTIAIDEAVTTNFLSANEQPGVFVRRFKNKEELTDEKMLTIWQEVFRLYPQADKKFVWDFSLSYYHPKTLETKTMSAVQIDNVALEFSKIINPGYPMSSFLIPENWSKTYSELNEAELLQIDQINLKQFIELIKSIIN